MSTVQVAVAVPVLGIVNFFGGIGTGIGKNWYRKKVSEPVSEKFGTGKKYRYRYRLKFWVPSYSAPGRITFIATLPWNALLAISVSIESVSSSARVTSVKSAKPLSLTDRDRDTKIGPQDTWVR